MTRSELIEKAISTFGVPRQFQQFTEEMGELLAAVSHYRRGKCTKEDLITEIADVKQMLLAIQYLFGISDEELSTIEDRQWAKLEYQMNQVTDPYVDDFDKLKVPVAANDSE